MVGQAGKIAFRIDHHLLHKACALFQQAAEKVRFTAAGIALHQQPRGEQFFHVDRHGCAMRVLADFDLSLHAKNDTGGLAGRLGMRDLYPVSRSRCIVHFRLDIMQKINFVDLYFSNNES